jgi:hypothetical protein
VEGEAVTPAGSPVSETATGVLLSLTPATVTINARAVPPLWRATVEGAAAIVKLGRMAGPEDVPHPTTKVTVTSNARGEILINGVLVKEFFCMSSLEFPHVTLQKLW